MIRFALRKPGLSTHEIIAQTFYFVNRQTAFEFPVWAHRPGDSRDGDLDQAVAVEHVEPAEDKAAWTGNLLERLASDIGRLTMRFEHYERHVVVLAAISAKIAGL